MIASDVIVIGSGFGGAFAAERLTAAGARVTLLERGPWRDTPSVRAAGVGPRSPLPRGFGFFGRALRSLNLPLLPGGRLRLNAHGLFDLHLGREISVVCSSGVGGGSHVYSAMNVRPAVPDYWRERADGIDTAMMDAHYDAAITRMGARIPDASVPNFIGTRLQQNPLLRPPSVESQPAMGFRFESSTFTDNSFFGCHDGSKVTLDSLLLLPALARGLQVHDLHEVALVGPVRDGWCVTAYDHRAKVYRHLTASRVVLAAGTLNTLRLLFASRDAGALGAVPALGLGVGGNGDVPAYWRCNTADADYSRGTPCHGRFGLRDIAPGSEDDVDLTAYGLNGIDGVPMPEALRRALKRDLILVGMGADQANGLATWTGGRLRLHYSRTANFVLARIYRAFDRIAARSARPVYFLRHWPLTVHPLGGARVGDDPQQAVLDGYGQVHGVSGLYVADAAALPAAPGAPPSMTVAAWASHVAAGIAAQG
ncbi:GMC family oxidoreductase [Sinimarinibacterium sp. CAU 1509]|uniref:GMC oxidoreductase n=1 Tax=Sinimarinibacterium sp. CAU 1509 TaxID=2562283 RepID=UPI0010ABEC4D|nr:GMC oxidoreductase [Sinimarinibacterium sp. CAU 1509]TJY63111.1 GMC family oxidoreductase [Sinimarinibacterium sp. CAU 1509]